MVRTVESRTDQVVHSGIHHQEVAVLPFLHIKDLSDERAALGDQGTSRFDVDGLVRTVPEVVVDGHEPGLEVGDRIAVRIVVVDAQSSSKVDVPDHHTVGFETGHYVVDLFAFELDDVRHLEDLGSDVELKTVEVDVRIGSNHRCSLIETPVGDSELVLVKACCDVVMGVRVDVRIDPETDGSLAA